MEYPLVSVLMPAYNCAPYVETSIKAILDQTFTNFEFIIVNDGSTDNTKQVIQSFSDSRIRYLENEKNSGIVKTLNKGLAAANGKYILRTDADDIAINTMVEKLAGFLEENGEHIICGGNMKLIGGEKIFSYPSENDELKIYTLNACPFSHSTVIFRRQVLVENGLQYDERVKDGEDHALWSDLLPYGDFHNLKDVTLLYRESVSQVTAQKEYAGNYIAAREKIFARQAVKYFLLDEEDTRRYAGLIINRKAPSKVELEKTGVLLKKILLHNQKAKLFNQSLLKHFLFIKWYALCANSYHLGKAVFWTYLKYLQGNKVGSSAKSIGIQFVKMLQA